MMTMSSNLLDFLNPLKRGDPVAYISFWRHLFETVLEGFWPRVIAAMALTFAFWFGVYRRRFLLGAFLFAVSFMFAYLGSILKAAFWWVP